MPSDYFNLLDRNLKSTLKVQTPLEATARVCVEGKAKYYVQFKPQDCRAVSQYINANEMFNNRERDRIQCL
jgi:hypothetical protein